MWGQFSPVADTFTIAFTSHLPDGYTRSEMTRWAQDIRDEVHIPSRVPNALVVQAAEELADGVTIKVGYYE